MSFSSLTLQFGRVSKQAEAGLYVLHRFHAYLVKLVAADESYVKELQKINKHEDGKRKTMQVRAFPMIAELI